MRTEQRTRDLERFLAAFDHRHTMAVEPRLRQLPAPRLIIWKTDVVYLPVKRAHWLAEALPGAKQPIELAGARIFFPEEQGKRSIDYCATICGPGRTVRRSFRP